MSCERAYQLPRIISQCCTEARRILHQHSAFGSRTNVLAACGSRAAEALREGAGRRAGMRAWSGYGGGMEGERRGKGGVVGGCRRFSVVRKCPFVRHSPLPKSSLFYPSDSYLTIPDFFQPRVCNPRNPWLKLLLLEAAQTTPAIRILSAGHAPWQPRPGPRVVRSCSAPSKFCSLRSPNCFPMFPN